MTSEPAASPDLEALQARGGRGERHRRLLEDANAALRASPAPALLECVQTIHRILLAADAKALRSSVGWFGRLLGRDIVLQAEAEAMRNALGVHVMQARQQIDALTANDQRLQALGRELLMAVDDFGQQASVLADQIEAGAVADHAGRMHHLATLAASVRITSSHIELTLLNHRDLAQRIEQMLPRVELLLDQQRMLHAGLTEQAAFAAATDSLEALRGLGHANVADVAPDTATHEDATP